MVASSFTLKEDALFQLARPHRPRRASDWTEAKAVTFIVTLAARQSVTLAARSAGMSRKSAYLLRARNSAFSMAWDTACAAGESKFQGDKACEACNPPIAAPQGDTAPRRMSLEQFHELLSSWRSESDLALLAPAMPLP